MALGGDHVHGVLQRTDDGGKVFPRGIKAAGADIVAYRAPVLPGVMFLLGYFEDGTPVMGLPGCVMYAGATVFDLMLPKIAATAKSAHAAESRNLTFFIGQINFCVSIFYFCLPGHINRTWSA